MDPHSPNKFFATKYCFLILVDDTSFFFFFVIINFYKHHFIILIFFFFHEKNFFFMFRDVPGFSGMFLSPPQRPLCVVGRLGRKKKRARRAGWEGGREKRGSRRCPLPIVPRALSIFSIIDILMGIPSGSLCGGDRECSVFPVLSTPERNTLDI